MSRSPAFYLKSIVASAWFRLHGYRCSLVACEGRLPILYHSGTVTIGRRMVLRGRIARIEIGAGRNAQLHIGERCFINQGATISASRSIVIGDDALIGDFAAIYDSNYHQIDPSHPAISSPVVIGNNVWLGRGVLVLPGSEIGDHTVVAAHSVVKGILPARVLAAGNPATVVHELDIPPGWQRV